LDGPEDGKKKIKDKQRSEIRFRGEPVDEEPSQEAAEGERVDPFLVID